MAVNQKIIRLCVLTLCLLQFSILVIPKSFAQAVDDTIANDMNSILENEENSSTASEAATSTEPEQEHSDESVSGEDNQMVKVSEPSSDLNTNQMIIERLQLVVQPGSTPDEHNISCYFIFWNKSPDFFHEINQDEKQLIFELKNTKVGSNPILSFSEPPIENFTIKQDTTPMIKALKEKKSQWDNLLRITFNFEAVPNIHVTNADGIIYFTFNWTSDPLKQKNYTLKKRSSKIILLSSSGVGGIAAGALGYLFIYPQLYPKEPDPPPAQNILSIRDLPTHPPLP